MVTFTVPAELRACFIAEPKLAYDGLMKASAEALKDLIANKHNGAQAGFISVLHTWGRQIQHHPHVHCIVPAVAFDAREHKVKKPKQANAFFVHFARYVQRSAITPKRLLGYTRDGKVRVSWTNSNTGKKGVMTLTPHEFIRRWLLHVLPKGFIRVRHNGFLSPAAKKTRLFIRALLGEIGEPETELPGFLSQLHKCCECGCELRLVKTFKPIRPPPWI